MIVGLVLAGGRSRRFGREKAVALLGDQPLIARVVRVLERDTAQVGVNAPEASAAAAFARAEGLACLPDAAGEVDGPLAGIRAGLRWARLQGAGWLATAPCDTPFLPTGLVSRLLDEGCEYGAVAATQAGLQPLCALWPAKMLEALDKVPGQPPMRQLLLTLGAREVRFPDTHAFDNLNTPEEYALALRQAD